MKILVTGVAGFIGSHLAECLLKNGAKVIGINNALSILEKLLKKKLQIKYIEKQKGDARDTFTGTTKARKELGYRPIVGLEEGLKEEILRFQERRL